MAQEFATPPAPEAAASAAPEAAASASPQAAATAVPEAAAGSGETIRAPRPHPAPASAASAKGGDSAAGFSFSSSNGPIDIKSDALSLDYKGKSVVFTGHVHAVQSGTQLTSDTLTVNYGEDFHDIKQVVADRNVKISQGGRWATGDHAVLDQTARTVEMTGNPVIHDGPDQITGSRILLYLDTQKSVVEGARAVIFPRKQETRDNTGDDHSAGSGD
jgi:lipopolysaccharide export system protein LptA